MKIFQIFKGVCWHEYTGLYKNAADAARHYAPDLVFVDAPDEVEAGWGFDGTQEGDARFIAPPEPEPVPEPEPTPTEQDRLEAQVLYTALMTDTLLDEEE